MAPNPAARPLSWKATLTATTRASKAASESNTVRMLPTEARPMPMVRHSSGVNQREPVG